MIKLSVKFSTTIKFDNLNVRKITFLIFVLIPVGIEPI